MGGLPALAQHKYVMAGECGRPQRQGDVVQVLVVGLAAAHGVRGDIIDRHTRQRRLADTIAAFRELEAAQPILECSSSSIRQYPSSSENGADSSSK